MCSISWKKVDQNIVIAFNRDEQKSRPIALSPRLIKSQSISSIMPSDPQGGGSWISVNQFGVMFGILNLYEFDQSLNTSKEPNKFTSRGELINNLCHMRDKSEVSNFFKVLNLEQYRPFRLITISSISQTQIIWNGNTISKADLPAFVSSSSWQSESVINERHQRFIESGIVDSKTISVDSMINLHRDHSIKRDAYSICMHREDASTVSMSVISIGEKNVSFRYWNGAPCQVEESKALSIPLKKYR